MLRKITLLTLLALFSLTSYSYKFDTIVTFGDSLSDNGNLYNFLGGLLPKSPPYYEGRFSNGPVWIENLYQSYFPNGKIENFLDFAVGGAGAVLSYRENLPYTLQAEINDYLYLHSYTNKNKSLFVVWIGGNNYLNGPTNVDEITTAIVDAIGDNIKTLIDRGAVMFLVVNMPDISKTPQVIKDNHQIRLAQLVNSHNQKLLTKYNELKEQYPNVNFAYFDVHSLFKQVMDNPAQFNISNINEPCYDGDMYASLTRSESSLSQLDSYLTQGAKQRNVSLDEKTKQAILANPALKEALNVGYKSQSMQTRSTNESCSGYLFWDSVHPTAIIHQLIAQYAKTTLDASGFEPINQ